MGALLNDFRFQGSFGFYLGEHQDEIICYGNEDLKMIFYTQAPVVDVEIKGLMDVQLGDCCAVNLIRNILKRDKKAGILKGVLNTWMKDHPSLLTE